MTPDTGTPLLDHFATLIRTPEDLARLNDLILQLAVQGKLVPQDPADEPASELLKRIRVEKKQLEKEGRIPKGKPLPQISEDEKPFDLPKGWVWVRLDEIVTKLGAGSTPKGGKNVYQDDGIKFIRSQNVWNDGLKLDEVAYISEKINQRMSGSIVEPQDILLNITGASIARSALVPDDFDLGNVNQHVTIIRLVNRTIRQFVHSWIISPFVYRLIMKVQVGISREGLSLTNLKMFPIPLPPLAEQKRIVARVEELLGMTRALEAQLIHAAHDADRLHASALHHLLEAQSPDEFQAHWAFIADHFDILYRDPAHLDALKQVILQLAVQGKLVPQDPADEPASALLKRIQAEKKRLWEQDLLSQGKDPTKSKYKEPIMEFQEDLPDIPKGWIWASADQFCLAVNNGSTPEANLLYEDVGEVPFIKVYNLTFDGTLDFTKKPTFIDQETHQTKLKRSITLAGDVLTNIVGPPLGKVSIVPDLYPEWNINQAIVSFRPGENISKEFLAYLLLSPPTIARLTFYTRGTAGQDNIRLSTCRITPMPLPPLAEQKRIVVKVEALLGMCDALAESLVSAEAVRGQWVEAVVRSGGK